MSASLFAYGTLVFPEVFAAIVGREIESSMARLEGFERCQLRDRLYPAIVPSAGGAVDGVLYRGLTEDELRRIDFFEDDEYVTSTVSVLAGSSTRVAARAYVLAASSMDSLVRQPWSAEDFKRSHLSDYLSNARSYMERYRSF